MQEMSSSKEPSDKMLVFWLWKKAKGKIEEDFLRKAVNNRIKLSSIVTWISAWKNEDGFPVR